MPSPDRSPTVTDATSLGHAALRETRDGWVLTLAVSPRMAEKIEGFPIEVGQRCTLGPISMTVQPNLVPGDRFTVDVVEVLVDGEPAEHD